MMLGRSDAPSRRKERRELVRLQLAQSAEGGPPRKRADADQAHRFLLRHMPANEHQEWNSRRTASSASSSIPPGTGPSCSGSAQMDIVPGMPAASMVVVVAVPFAT